MLELACAFLFSQDNNCIIFYYVLDFFHSVSIWRDFWRTVIWHFCSCTLAVPPCARFHGSHVFSDLLTRLKSRPLLRTWEKDKEFPWSVCVARPEEQFERTFSTLLWKMLSVQCPDSAAENDSKTPVGSWWWKGMFSSSWVFSDGRLQVKNSLNPGGFV